MTAELRGVNTTYRLKRFKLFLNLLSTVANGKRKIRVLDVGGTAAYWKAYEELWRPFSLEITTINPVAEISADPRIRTMAGNGCRMPQFADSEFDIVHSNSVIEHVGRWAEMREMAGEISRLAPAYFVQTPSVWCPIEPHYRLPLIHWMPEPIRVAAIRKFRLGFYEKATDIDSAMKAVEDAVLLDMPRMKALFPDAQIMRETLGYVFTKSYIAVRDVASYAGDADYQETAPRISSNERNHV